MDIPIGTGAAALALAAASIPIRATPIRRAGVLPPYSGRLIVLDNRAKANGGGTFDLLSNAASIDFPMMPKDGIQLDRSANYDVYPGWGIPDGIHQYKNTEPLSIPISFAVSIHDRDYCPRGAYTLLQIAARLHAMVLPIGTDESFNVTVGLKKADEKAQLNGAAQPGVKSSQDSTSVERNSAGAPFSVGRVANAHIYAPVSCRLELLYTVDRGPGIVCNGYVKNVSAKLKGPFLRGQGNSFNLPSAGEFSFTFIHRPGHGNNYEETSAYFGTQPHAHADIVKNSFYNTRWMTKDVSYRGFLTDVK